MSDNSKPAAGTPASPPSSPAPASSTPPASAPEPAWSDFIHDADVIGYCAITKADLDATRTKALQLWGNRSFKKLEYLNDGQGTCGWAMWEASQS